MPRRAQPKRFAVIMAGGAGTRFWPLSRRSRPKQLLPIASRRTMVQDTVGRLGSLIAPRRIVVVTGKEHAAAVRQQLPQIPAENILVEPIGRNTAPCIAAAAEWIHCREAESTMVVLPADHAITRPAAFRRALRRAFAVAEHNHALVTLGARPTHPETGYGYIKVGAPIVRTPPAVFHVDRFCEKPRASVARRFVADGHYRWNTGIFVWQTRVIREAIACYLPEVAHVMSRIGSSWQSAVGGGRQATTILPAARYRRLPSVSIDVAVMEKAAAAAADFRVAVVSAEFGWSDVGSWAALASLWGRDRRGNAARGKALLLDTAGVTVFNGSHEKLIALLGVRDLVVVDTPDALLVCPVERVQDVRTIVTELTRRAWHSFL